MLIDTLQELLYGLYALISVYFREEEIQLPAFDTAPPEATETVLKPMEFGQTSRARCSGTLEAASKLG